MVREWGWGGGWGVPSHFTYKQIPPLVTDIYIRSRHGAMVIALHYQTVLQAIPSPLPVVYSTKF
jgi:hypothetical protein